MITFRILKGNFAARVQYKKIFIKPGARDILFILLKINDKFSLESIIYLFLNQYTSTNKYKMKIFNFVGCIIVIWKSRRCSVRKGVLSQNPQENTCARVSF